MAGCQRPSAVMLKKAQSIATFPAPPWDAAGWGAGRVHVHWAALMLPETDGEGISAAFVEPSSLGFPRCVDLDGTLLCTDTLWEEMILLLRRRPWLVFLAPFWLLRGRAHFKREVAANIELNVALLP